MKTDRLYKLLMWLTGIWTLFTVALAIWWFTLVSRLVKIQFENESHELLRYRRMITQEGLAMILLLVGGGLAMLAGIYFLQNQNKKLRSFFAVFTHELKTPLTNVRIQTEILRDQISDSNQQATLERLANEGVRLELQLENSLFIADDGQSPLFFEKVDIVKLAQSVSQSWPSLKLNVTGQNILSADRRALEAIFRNLFQNSKFHGRAATAHLKISEVEGVVELEYTDDGSGFQGDVTSLAKLFDRKTSKSGTGVGLWLIKNLSQRLKGDATFSNENGRLKTSLKFPRLS